MLPFGMVGSHKWVVLKAIMCTAASCGFRLDEVSDWEVRGWWSEPSALEISR